VSSVTIVNSPSVFILDNHHMVWYRVRVAKTISIVVILSGLLGIASSRAQVFTFYPEFEFVYRNYPSVRALGRGNTGVADRGRLDLATLNPASLQPSNAVEAFASSGEKNPEFRIVEFRVGNHESYMGARQENLPYAFGTALRLSDRLSTGILYYRYGDIIEDLGETVMGNPEGPPSSARSGAHLRGEALTLPVSCALNENISLGADLQRIHYNVHVDYAVVTEQYELDVITEDRDYDIYNVKIGSVIAFNRNLSVGVTFLPERRKELSTEKDDFLYSGTYEFLSPLELQFGLKYTAGARPLSILFDVFYQGTSEAEYLNDHTDLRFGAEYEMRKSFSLRSGILHLRDARDLGSNSIVDEANITYLTLGAGLSFARAAFDVSVITTRLTPGSEYENTSFALGMHLPF
jgi:hypothetical protein